MDLIKLSDKFKPEDLEWRAQSSDEKNGSIWCTVLVYVNNRAIMDRLDEVCGPQGWYNDFKPGPLGGILCGISINIKDDVWVTKWDGAENTNIDAVKGGLSGSMKRAGVQWGIGRYLYDFPKRMYANVHSKGANYGKTKNKKPFNWDPPAVPQWALPEMPTPEADELAKTKEVLPELYDKMVEHYKGVPVSEENCKVANEWISAESKKD